MRTNIDLDDNLIIETQRLSKLKTKRQVVEAALKIFLEYLQRQEMLELRGQVRWEGDLEAMRQA